jgi:hypothetical protein
VPLCDIASQRQKFNAIQHSESYHRSGQPVRLTRWRTPRRSLMSRSLARVDAKKPPSNKFLEPVFEPLSTVNRQVHPI